MINVAYLQIQLLTAKELGSFVFVKVKRHLLRIFYQEDFPVFDFIRMKLLPVSLYLQSTNLNTLAGRNEEVHGQNHKVTTLPLHTASIDNLIPEKG